MDCFLKAIALKTAGCKAKELADRGAFLITRK
jgi:hypothetical protein